MLIIGKYIEPLWRHNYMKDKDQDIDNVIHREIIKNNLFVDKILEKANIVHKDNLEKVEPLKEVELSIVVFTPSEIETITKILYSIKDNIDENTFTLLMNKLTN
jgi:hypothetical protein